MATRMQSSRRDSLVWAIAFSRIYLDSGGIGTSAGRRLFLGIGTFFIVLAILATPSLLKGQGSASINGTVTDASGAVVPGADISVSSQATNATRATQTDATGSYSVTSLTPGTYDITVAKAGLKTIKFAAVTLTVDQALTLDTKLEVSSASATVTVEGTASRLPAIRKLIRPIYRDLGILPPVNAVIQDSVGR